MSPTLVLLWVAQTVAILKRTAVMLSSLGCEQPSETPPEEEFQTSGARAVTVQWRCAHCVVALVLALQLDQEEGSVLG